jgi:zinc finger protein
METLSGQQCPICGEKTLTLHQTEEEIPYFGKMFVFGMNCSSCKYSKGDIEADKVHDPAKFVFEVSSAEDMKVRVVKSSEATVKIPHIITITPGPASDGFVSNIEGLLERVKKMIESARDAEEDEDVKKKAKNMLKKLTRVMWGSEKIKITIEDPTGNSAIISDKAVKSKLKV